jgi:hypothetical protein
MRNSWLKKAGLVFSLISMVSNPRQPVVPDVPVISGEVRKV